MRRTITILGEDPAFQNYGLALVDVDLDTLELLPRWIRLVETEKTKLKQVRASSDKMRRATQISQIVRLAETEAQLIAAEIPSGAQSASAANALGIALGIAAGHIRPLIEVSAAEAKKAATGYSDASKADMVEWAHGLWPDLKWARGKGAAGFPPGLGLKNEHMADALAIVKAATLTPQFGQMIAVLKVAA